MHRLKLCPTTVSVRLLTVEPPEVFSAARKTREAINKTAVVNYNDVLVNTATNFDSMTNKYTAPASDIYWFPASVGISAYDTMSYSLVGGQYDVNIYRTNTAPTGPDTQSRDIIQAVEAGQELYVSSSSPTYSNDRRQTMWGGVRLSSVFQQVIAFAVARDSEQRSVGTIQFDRIYVNTGNGWDNTTNEFVAPRDGIYYLSFSAAVSIVYSLDVRLVRNGARIIKLWRGHQDQKGMDTLSRATLLSMTAGDRVKLELVSGGVYSDSSQQTSFSGFLVEQSDPSGVIAWSAHKTGGETIKTNPPAEQPPVSFNQTFVNVGGAWDGTYIRAPVSGIYYVHINAGACTRTSLQMTLTTSAGNALADVFRNSTYHNGPDTLGRSIIVELLSQQTAFVRMDCTCYYSDPDRITSISGFLLFSYETLG